MTVRSTILLASILVLALPACGTRDADGQAGAERADAVETADLPELPSPAGDPTGSVTGMPAPGSGGDGEGVSLTEAARDPTAAPRGLAEDEHAQRTSAGFDLADGDGHLPGATPPLSTVSTGARAVHDEDAATAGADAASSPDATRRGGEEAMATIRRYYASISAGNHAVAHGMWAGGGSASGQSLEQFSTAFADTADVRVHMMEPQAQGPDRIRIPVTIDTTGRDGSRAQFTGSYRLRREGSEGWRIESADLREVVR